LAKYGDIKKRLIMNETLTSSPYSFEILQIETVSLFFVVMATALATWETFRRGGAQIAQNRETWAFIAVSLFLGLTGALTYSLGGSLFLFALELSFAILLAALRPANALALFICLQFLRPWEVAEENALLLALPRMTGLLVIASAFASYLRSGLNRFQLGAAQWLLILFAAWTLLTTVFTPTPADQQRAYFETFFRAVVIFFLIVAAVRDQADLSLLRRVYLWSVTGLAGISIYLSWGEIFGGDGMSTDRLHAIGTLENANDIAAVMVVGIPFALRNLSESRRKPLVWVESLSFLLVTMVALYLAQSRGALLALAIGGFGWWALTAKKKWLVVLLGFLVVASAAPFANVVLRRSADDLNESGSSRFTYWQAGIRMVAKNPIFGVGFGRYPKEYQSNAGNEEQFEFGERTAHSTWILALAETGVPGFLFFVAFVISVLRMARRILPSEPDLFVALVAYLIAISFLSHTYLIYPYILMGLIVAAYRIHFRSRKGWAM
jgi:O-antigen ligase